MNIVNLFFDLLHFIFLLLPIGIFFIPIQYFWVTRIIILMLLLTPLHWGLIDDKCILSIVSKKFGGLKNSQYNSPFTEKYLGWLFYLIMDLFKMKRNKKNLDKLIYLQWFVSFLAIYYYIFYYIECVPHK